MVAGDRHATYFWPKETIEQESWLFFPLEAGRMQEEQTFPDTVRSQERRGAESTGRKEAASEEHGISTEAGIFTGPSLTGANTFCCVVRHCEERF